MIRVENIVKDYHIYKLFEGLNLKTLKRIRALDGVSFALESNRIVGILGHNGAGKTTLLKIFTGILSPDNGDIIWGEVSLKDNNEYFKYNIGFINAEERSFYWRLTVWENLKFFMGISCKKIDEGLIIDILRLLGIEQLRNMPFRMLSSGMKAKVQIARALLKEPEMLIMDEPFSNLDYNSREEIKAFLRDWVKKNNRTILITSHHLEEISRWIDETVILDKGKCLTCIKEPIIEREMLKITYNDGREDTVDLSEIKKNGLTIEKGIKYIEILNRIELDLFKGNKDGH